MKKYTFEDLTLDKEYSNEELKSFLSILKKDMKITEKKGIRKKRAYELLNLNSLPIYSSIQNQNFQTKFIEEKKRANDFLNNEEETEKAGWNYIGGKKSILAENNKKQEIWANLAYPNISHELWEANLDIDLIIHFLKKNK